MFTLRAPTVPHVIISPTTVSRDIVGCDIRLLGFGNLGSRLSRLGRLGRLIYDFIIRYYRLPLTIRPSFSYYKQNTG